MDIMIAGSCKGSSDWFYVKQSWILHLWIMSIAHLLVILEFRYTESGNCFHFSLSPLKHDHNYEELSLGELIQVWN